MNRAITRRDFVYGLPALAGLLAACQVTREETGTARSAAGGAPAGASPGRPGADPFAAVPAGASLEPGPDWYGPGGVGDYAPSHGNTPDVLKAAHGVRIGRFDADAVAAAHDTGEEYDLVVIGGGFAGLAAAHHFRRLQGQGRCLILDNHPIFGGEAKRNEFDVDGHRLVGPQGSNDFGIQPHTGGPEDSTSGSTTPWCRSSPPRRR